MSHRILQASFATIFTLFSCVNVQGKSQLPEALEALNQQTIAKMEGYKDIYQLPSLSLSIAIKGEVVFKHAVGFADISSKHIATTETQYSVGSIAKPITSIALAKLLDVKKIALDDDIHQYLPEYPTLAHKLTIRQLASHTGGIGRPWDARNKREYAEVRDHKSPFEALDLFKHNVLEFKPGEGFAYTSSGYILLSAVIEKAAEKNYIDYMQQSVWSPLNMVHTEHDTSFAGENEATYYESVNDKGHHIPSTTVRDRSYLFGGGGFISTPTDLVNMAQAFYRPGFLSSRAKDALFTPVKLVNGDDNEQRYGLGWRMIDIPTIKINGQVPKLVHHGGVTDKAATAFLLLMPEYEAAIAYTINMNSREAASMRAEVAQLLADYINQL
jgi:CubicO group peptidase (beta-lactamase class C family)